MRPHSFPMPPLPPVIRAVRTQHLSALATGQRLRRQGDDPLLGIARAEVGLGVGDVAGGGPVTLPDANLFTNGAWYGGSPYLGPNATLRATGCGAGSLAGSCGATGTTPPSGTIANSPSGEAGFAFMWHSHNEREITTNNIFPGGMLMMMLVDSREFPIDESN